MNNLTLLSMKRPISTLIVLFGSIIFGIFAFSKSTVELMPDVDTPIIAVTTVLPGASPEVVDKDVTDILEEQINAVNGLKSLNSQSFEGRSLIIAEFELDRKIDEAAADVRAKVNLAKRDLPKDAEEPIVDKFSPWLEPFIILTVEGGENYRQRLRITDKVIKRKLQTINGVGSVNLVGGPDREIRIELDPLKMQARNITTSQVMAAVQAKHKELPGGRIETEELEYSIRIQGEYKNALDMSKLVVSSTDGFVRLEDIATVVNGFQEKRDIARINGKDVLALELQKQQGANEVKTASLVQEAILELQPQLPDSIKIKTSHDSSRFIHRTMKGVRSDLISGVILTSLLMWLFLWNPRPTAVAVTAIPVSLISTFSILYVLGITVNNLSMLGISLAIGLVIDNTIVVIENIFRFKSMGKSSWESALEGSREVFFSVLAGTATTVSVFLPVAFMDNMMGRYLYSYGMTIVVSVSISFLVSITLTPFMASRILKDDQKIPETGWFLTKLQQAYSRILAMALKARVITLCIAFATFVIAIILGSTAGLNFVPDRDQGRFNIKFELPAGASLNQTLKVCNTIEHFIKDMKETSYYYSTIGGGATEEVNKGQVHVYLTPMTERENISLTVNKVRKTLISENSLKDVAISVVIRPMKAVSYALQGNDYELLASTSRKLESSIKQQGFLKDVEFSLKEAKPTLGIQINRELADELGVDVANLSSEIYNLVQGIEIANFKENGYRYEITLRADKSYRDNPEDILNYRIRGKNNRTYPLATIAEVKMIPGANRIDRYNRVWAITLEANPNGVPTAEAMERIETMVKETAPSGIRLEKTGESKGMRESLEAMLLAFLFSVLIVYMVMAIQFESFLYPFIVMGSLPLSAIGVFGLLAIIQMPLNILIFMGMILLVGIVVNNAIILVDFINQERARGVERDQAILNSAPLRLRPILMTASSTIISVVPVALGMSEGAELRQPMSIAVIGGMITSSPLTLIVIPVLYSLTDDISAFFLRLMGKKQPTESNPETTSEKLADELNLSGI